MPGGKFWSGNTKAAKLTPAEVLALRADYAAGMTQGALTRKYGIGIAQVGRIVRREVWQDVVEPEMGQGELAASAARMLALQESLTKRMSDSIAEEKERSGRGDRLLGELTGEKDGK